MDENRAIKPIKIVLKGGGRGRRKGGCEYDQSPLYANLEISQ
jgi:hypothetical protein